MVNAKLLAARKAKRWSIEVASARVGVSRITYSRWENGHQEPQPSVLALLFQAFGMSADALGYEHLLRYGKQAVQSNQLSGEDPMSHSSHEPKRLGMDELSFFVSLVRGWYMEGDGDTSPERGERFWFTLYRHCPNLMQAIAARFQGDWREITFTRDLVSAAFALDDTPTPTAQASQEGGAER
jgi:transcriptional regulator with XRE-family HTH domain